MSAAKLISPAIESSFAAGFDWYVNWNYWCIFSYYFVSCFV